MTNRHQAIVTEKLSEAILATSMAINVGLTLQLPTDAAWPAPSIPARATEIRALATGWAFASVTEVENIESAISIRTFERRQL